MKWYDMLILTYNKKPVASVTIWSTWIGLVSLQEPYIHIKIYILLYVFDDRSVT